MESSVSCCFLKSLVESSRPLRAFNMTLLVKLPGKALSVNEEAGHAWLMVYGSIHGGNGPTRVQHFLAS